MSRLSSQRPSDRDRYGRRGSQGHTGRYLRGLWEEEVRSARVTGTYWALSQGALGGGGGTIGEGHRDRVLSVITDALCVEVRQVRGTGTRGSLPGTDRTTTPLPPFVHSTPGGWGSRLASP